jgi:hypothetical protein
MFAICNASPHVVREFGVPKCLGSLKLSAIQTTLLPSDIRMMLRAGSDFVAMQPERDGIPAASRERKSLEGLWWPSTLVADITRTSDVQT